MSDNSTQAPARAITPDGFKVYCAFDEIVELETLKPNPKNSNKHPDAQVKMLAHIISNQGWRAPITISRRSGLIVRGHARRLSGYEAGTKFAPIEWQDYENESAEMADLVADNKIAELAVLDEWAISEILAELEASTDGVDMELTGFTAEQIKEIIDTAKVDREAEEQAARLTLQERFLISPFTILDARSGFWAERKKAWKRLGIHSEIGRGKDEDKTAGGLTFARSSQPPGTYEAKNAYEAKIGQKISWEEFSELFPDQMAQGGTSIFDPVVCEVGYRWFCPQGGSIIDPFAGGSVRGTAGAMGTPAQREFSTVREVLRIQGYEIFRSQWGKAKARRPSAAGYDDSPEHTRTGPGYESVKKSPGALERQIFLGGTSRRI